MMKRNFALWAVILTGLLSCQLETVTVVTNPKISVPGGTITKDLSEYLSPAEFKSNMGSGFSDAQISVVNSPDGIYTLELKKSLQKYSLKNFFSDTVNLNTTVAQDVPTVSFTIPNLDATPITLNIPFSIPGVTSSPPVAVTVPQFDLTNAFNIPLNTDPTFVSGVIGIGSLTISIPEPAGFTSSSRSLNVAITQGGTPLKTQTLTSNPAVIDLAGVSIGTGNLKIEYTLTLAGTLAAGASVNQTLAGTAASSITNFASLKITMPELNLSKNISTPIEASVKKFVNSIILKNPSQVKVDLQNNLPTGLSVTVVSAPFGINQTLAVPKSLTPFSGAFNVTNFTIDVANMTSFDFDFKVEISGPGSSYDKVTKILTLSNVSPGDNYSFGGKVSVDITPIGANIKSDAIVDTYPAAGSPAMDFSALSKFFPSEITFNKAITVALNISGLANVSGNIGVVGKYNNNATSTNIITPQDFYTDDTGKMTDVTKTTPQSITGDLAGILNARPSDLRFENSFKINSLYVDLVNPLNTDVSVEMTMTIPFSLLVTPGPSAISNPKDTSDTSKYVPISLGTADPLDLKGEDLFKRKTVTDNNMDKIFDGTKSITFTIEVPENTTGLDFAFLMEYDLAVGKRTHWLSMKDKAKNVLTLDIDDVQAFKKVPFTPVMKLYISDGAKSLSSNAKFSTKMQLEIQTAINQKIDLKK